MNGHQQQQHQQQTDAHQQLQQQQQQQQQQQFGYENMGTSPYLYQQQQIPSASHPQESGFVTNYQQQHQWNLQQHQQALLRQQQPQQHQYQEPGFQQHQQQQALQQNGYIWASIPVSNAPVLLPRPPPRPPPPPPPPPPGVPASRSENWQQQNRQQHVLDVQGLPPPPPPPAPPPLPATNSQYQPAHGQGQQQQQLSLLSIPPPPLADKHSQVEKQSIDNINASSCDNDRIVATPTATDLCSVSSSSIPQKRKRRRGGTRKQRRGKESKAKASIKPNSTEAESTDIKALYSPTLMASITQKIATSRERGIDAKNKRQVKSKVNYYGPTISPSCDDTIPQQTKKLVGSTLSAPGFDAMDCSEDDDDDDDDVDDTVVTATAQNERLLQLKQKETMLLKRQAQATIGPGEEEDDAANVEQRLQEAKEQLRLAQRRRDELAQIRQGEVIELEDNRKPTEDDSTDATRKKKKAKALKKQLHAMKLRHAAAAAAQQLHHNQYPKQQGRQVPPLTALQEGRLNTLVIRDIGTSGPNNRVRFPTVFEPREWFPGDETSILLEQKEIMPQLSYLDRFADAPSDDTGDPTSLSPPITLASVTGSGAVTSGQFDDPDEDENLSVTEDASPLPDTVLASQSVTPRDTETEVFELPQVFPPGEESMDLHLKSISALKRKMELKRKAIELKEKLQRLGNNNGKHKSYRGQNVSWSRADTKNIDGEGTGAVKDDENTEVVMDESYVPLSMANLSKEELEERRLLAQQNMDVSQTKHFVSKQTYMLSEQQKKVNSNEQEIQQCRVLISKKRKELQDENTLQDNLQARKLAVDDMIQKQAEILIAKRMQLHSLRQSSKSNEQATTGDVAKSQQGQHTDN